MVHNPDGVRAIHLMGVGIPEHKCISLHLTAYHIKKKLVSSLIAFLKKTPKFELLILS